MKTSFLVTTAVFRYILCRDSLDCPRHQFCMQTPLVNICWNHPTPRPVPVPVPVKF